MFAIPTAAAGQTLPLEQNVGTVIVQFRTLVGGRLPAVNFSVRAKNGTSVLAETARDEAAIQLPYGEYVLTAEAKFLRSVSRAFTVDRPKSFVVLATGMDRFVLDMENSPVAVTVAVAPASACDPEGRLWAKLIPVYGEGAMEQIVSPNGYALFEPVDVGKYVILVVDGDRLRGIAAITTKGKVTATEIHLSDCS